MSKQTAKPDKKPDEGAAFWAGVIVTVLVAGIFMLIMGHTDEELYRRAYNDALRASTTCTEAMERVHEVCSSDKPSEPGAPPVFVPIPIPN